MSTSRKILEILGRWMRSPASAFVPWWLPSPYGPTEDRREER